MKDSLQQAWATYGPRAESGPRRLSIWPAETFDNDLKERKKKESNQILIKSLRMPDEKPSIAAGTLDLVSGDFAVG